MIQTTFVAEEGKEKKKARLSWYHPDDTVSTRTTAGGAPISAAAADAGRDHALNCVLPPFLSCLCNSVIGCCHVSDLYTAGSHPRLMLVAAVYADGAKGLVQRGPAEGSGLLQAFQHLSKSAQLC